MSQSENAEIARTSADNELIERVRSSLAEGKLQQALEGIRKSKNNSPWATNALGVCLLRSGDVSGALNAFRRVAMEPGGFSLRADAPTAFKTNFAIAMLLSDNLPGCLSTLAQIRDRSHPSVVQLRQTLDRWKASLSLWEKIQYYMGGQPNRRPVFDAPPGALD